LKRIKEGPEDVSCAGLQAWIQFEFFELGGHPGTTTSRGGAVAVRVRNGWALLQPEKG